MSAEAPIPFQELLKLPRGPLIGYIRSQLGAINFQSLPQSVDKSPNYLGDGRTAFTFSLAREVDLGETRRQRRITLVAPVSGEGDIDILFSAETVRGMTLTPIGRRQLLYSGEQDDVSDELNASLYARIENGKVTLHDNSNARDQRIELTGGSSTTSLHVLAGIAYTLFRFPKGR